VNHENVNVSKRSKATVCCLGYFNKRPFERLEWDGPSIQMGERVDRHSLGQIQRTDPSSARHCNPEPVFRCHIKQNAQCVCLATPSWPVDQHVATFVNDFTQHLADIDSHVLAMEIGRIGAQSELALACQSVAQVVWDRKELEHMVLNILWQF